MIKPETVRAFGALAPDAQGNPRWTETRTTTTYDTKWGRPDGATGRFVAEQADD
jgi:hypothetical protein